MTSKNEITSWLHEVRIADIPIHNKVIKDLIVWN